jgi:hypothetical protein
MRVSVFTFLKLRVLSPGSYILSFIHLYVVYLTVLSVSETA